jgi:hypothetical protein
MKNIVLLLLKHELLQTWQMESSTFCGKGHRHMATRELQDCRDICVSQQIYLNVNVIFLAHVVGLNVIISLI